MNIMKRKIISLNLAIIMVLSLLPFGITPAKAADDIGYATFFQTILDKGIMPSEKVLDFPVDCNTLTGSVNL